MSEEELNQKIRELQYYVKKDDNKKAALLLQLIITTIGILATGILLGTIFGQMAICVMTAIFACIPIDATKAMEYTKLTDTINRYLDQIENYNKDIDRIHEKQRTNGKEKEKGPDTEKKKYEYRKGDTKDKDKPKSKDIPIEFFDESDFIDNDKKGDIPIEFFDESDFSDEPDQDNHKTR